MTNTTNTSTENLNDAIREYDRMSAANTAGRIGHTAEAWDDVAGRIEAALDGVSAGRREWFAARARDARLNAASLRARR